MAEGNRSREPSPPPVAADRGRKREREGDPIATVTDEEVEEFYAILRRMRRPVKYFGGGGRSGKRWRPSFVAEDFNAVSADDGAEKEKEKGVEGGRVRGLDLNVHPVTE
uniref:Uncharacterized protein n=1 Tax=Kalanchoe fedtschenkoi TaxID=63787 RepID=A0A7N0TKS8_KALFE